MRFKLREGKEIIPEKPKGHDKYKQPLEWDANEGRIERVNRYRQLTMLNEEDEITEDNIQDWALSRVCTEKCIPAERLRAELLKQPYTGYEQY